MSGKFGDPKCVAELMKYDEQYMKFYTDTDTNNIAFMTVCEIMFKSEISNQCSRGRMLCDLSRAPEEYLLLV